MRLLPTSMLQPINSKQEFTVRIALRKAKTWTQLDVAAELAYIITSFSLILFLAAYRNDYLLRL